MAWFHLPLCRSSRMESRSARKTSSSIRRPSLSRLRDFEADRTQSPGWLGWGLHMPHDLAVWPSRLHVCRYQQLVHDLRSIMVCQSPSELVCCSLRLIAQGIGAQRSLPARDNTCCNLGNLFHLSRILGIPRMGELPQSYCSNLHFRGCSTFPALLRFILAEATHMTASQDLDEESEVLQAD
jgi:hypothetical protein